MKAFFYWGWMISGALLCVLYILGAFSGEKDIHMLIVGLLCFILAGIEEMRNEKK